MKPAPFEYHAPTTVAETVALLEQHGPEAKVLAGGQSLVPLLNMRLARPTVVVDVGRVADLDYIREEDGALAIGAMTTQRTVERSELVEQRLPFFDGLSLVKFFEGDLTDRCKPGTEFITAVGLYFFRNHRDRGLGCRTLPDFS